RQSKVEFCTGRIWRLPEGNLIFGDGLAEVTQPRQRRPQVGMDGRGLRMQLQERPIAVHSAFQIASLLLRDRILDQLLRALGCRRSKHQDEEESSSAHADKT